MSPAHDTRGTSMHVHGSVRRVIATGAAAIALLLVLATAALAAPVMDMTPVATTSVAPGGTLNYFVWISNVGADPTNDVLTLDVNLPSAFTATSAIDNTATGWSCTIVDPQTVHCDNTSVLDPHTPDVRNSLVQLAISVDGGASEGDVVTQFHLAGGGANPVDQADETAISNAPPAFGIDAFDGQVTSDEAGDPFTQAGGHPYEISTAIFFNTINNTIPRKGPLWPVEATKDILVDLPPGLVGNPTVTGNLRCTQAQLSNAQGINARPLCPPGSQVGTTKVFTSDGALLADALPVFNLVAPPTVPARFGFNIAGTVVMLDATLRSGTDYGLSVNLRDVSEGIAAAGAMLSFWGVPADPAHDPNRACPGQQGPGEGGPACTTELAPRAFVRMPTSCTGAGLLTTARVDSWFDPGDFTSASFTSHLPPAFPFPSDQWGAEQGTTGCADVPFSPKLAGAPVDPSAGKPSAFTFDLSMPQTDDPDQIGEADLKKAVVTLPVGLRVSPSSANGLGACAPANIALHTDASPTCPAASKIGTVMIDTPLLDDPLTGSIYLGKQTDNPFGTLLSVYLVARGPGLVVKLPGRVDADELTGQLTATFDDNPQLPFSNLHLEFKGGDRAALVNPPACGTYTTHAVLTSWSGATVASDSSFAISKDGNGTACAPSQFTPRLEAGGSDVKAGQNTTFSLRVTRDDADEELKGLSVAMPKGLLAKVAGLPLCPADKADAGTCDEGSRIGDVVTGAGAGDQPFYLPGRAYLTEAYNKGPFGLSIVVPAVAGPFDLGTVVVRASVRIDKFTSQLSVVSDPLPTILQGIPLQIRDVRVTIDRSKFMVNPTSCVEKQVRAAVTSTAGKTADLATRFQVGGCSKLKLAPKMTLTVGSKGHVHRGHATPLTAELTQTPGQSNLRSVAVTLPLSINALLPVVEKACTQAQFDVGDCEGSRTGSAVAVTPLLDRPLRGAAYFVKRPAGQKGLPNLEVALRGQVDFNLVGHILIPRDGRLETKFDTVPDVPISSFTLHMDAGRHGAVSVAENLCKQSSQRERAQLVFQGQNGALVRSSQRLHIHGCGGGK